MKPCGEMVLSSGRMHPGHGVSVPQHEQPPIPEVGYKPAAPALVDNEPRIHLRNSPLNDERLQPPTGPNIRLIIPLRKQLIGVERDFFGYMPDDIPAGTVSGIMATGMGPDEKIQQLLELWFRNSRVTVRMVANIFIAIEQSARCEGWLGKIRHPGLVRPDEAG